MRAIIIANGTLTRPMGWSFRSDDFIIAVDGGADLCRKLHRMPSVVIGDMDSISKKTLSELETAGVEIIRYAEEKNETDLELALEYAKKIQADEIILIAALGTRWDHSIANILLLTNPKFEIIKIKILHGREKLFIIRAGEAVELKGKSKELVSLIPLKGNVRGVTLKGFKFPLNNETLPFCTARGVSNELKEEQASIHIKEGILLCVITKK